MGLFTTKCVFCGDKVKKSLAICPCCGRDMSASREPKCFTLSALVESPRARTRRIPANMFWTLEEAQEALGRSEDEIKELAREGRLRAFHDGTRTLYKAAG